MFTIDESLKDLKVKERKIFKILYSMNSHPVAMPGYASEDARCYILFFSEGPNLSAFIGLYLSRVDEKFFYTYTSNPFPFEAQQDVEDEAKNFAEEMGFLLDEINVSGMAVEDRNHWIEEQFIFGYKSPEPAPEPTPRAAAPVEEEQAAPVGAVVAEAPTPPAPPAPEPQPAPFQQTPVLQTDFPPLAEPQPPVPPQADLAPPSLPAQPSYPSPQYPAGYPTQAAPPQQAQTPAVPQPFEHQQVSPPILEHPPVLEHPVEREREQQKPRAKDPLPPPVKKKASPGKAAPDSLRAEQMTDDIPVDLQIELPEQRPRSLFEEAVKQGVVKPPKPKPAKTAQSTAGAVSRDKEALARLLASF